MAAIVETVVSDKRLVLAGEEIIRPMPWGNNWTQMRVGIRFGIWGAHLGNTVQIINITQFGGLTLCVCQGPQGWMHDRPKDVVGLRFPNHSTSLTNSAVNVNPQYYSMGNNQNAVIRKISTGVVQNATAAQQLSMVSSNPHLVRNVMMATITKGSPMTIAIHSCTSAGQVQADTTRQIFLNLMGTTTPGATYVSNSGATNLTYTGGDMTFDHVAVGWNKYVPGIEIMDIGITRFY